jgi:hypothetical protein
MLTNLLDCRQQSAQKSQAELLATYTGTLTRACQAEQQNDSSKVTDSAGCSALLHVAFPKHAKADEQGQWMTSPHSST